MSLLTQNTEVGFNTDIIHKGDLIRAQYNDSGEDAWNGIVANVSAGSIRVLSLPGLGNVTNYFTILAKEVEAGKWTIRWSTDLKTIQVEGGKEEVN